MADEHSFDIVCEVDMQEVTNAVNQAVKEIGQRFDFKGSKSSIELDKGKGTITLLSDDDLDDLLCFFLRNALLKRNDLPYSISCRLFDPAVTESLERNPPLDYF